MAEIAGIVLGAAGILVPAYQGYQICSTVIADAKDFSKNFRKIKLDLKTQKDIFSGECELLLKGIIDNSVLQEMLRDQEHDQWKDAGFQAAFYSYLGGSLEDKFTPFRIVRETLDEIMKEVSEFQDKMNSCLDPAASTLAEASRRVKSIGKRVNWALSKKTKLLDLIETLRRQNGALFQLRSQTEAKARLGPQENNHLQRGVASPLSEHIIVQEISMKLQKALASTAVCHCHKVNLRLDSEPRNPARFNFRFVLTEDSVTSASSQSIIQSQSTCLLIESGPGAIVEGSSAVNSCKSSQVVVLEKQAVTHKNTEKRAGRRVQFDMGSSSMDLRDSSTTGCVARDTLPIAAPAPQSVLEAIDDLCNFLKKTEGLTNGRSTCLGYVKSDDSYNHIVYRDLPETLAPASRISLYYILSSLNMPEKQKLLPRGDRLKLGLALSLSVLHFGSYTDSWFKEHWRSQDIYFFGDRQQHELSSISSPHVATSLSYISGGELSAESGQQAGTTLARNVQLFSLAIVLIEIAYGDLLCNIFENGGRTEGLRKLDEVAEYLKAKRISDSVGREMGKKYADVVKRCLYCDFGVDESDLSNRKLQEMYFTHVVCKLEQCVRQFSN